MKPPWEKTRRRYTREFKISILRESGNGSTYKEAARVEELERLVGQLYAENKFLKKVLTIGEESAGGERKIEAGVKFMVISVQSV